GSLNEWVGTGGPPAKASTISRWPVLDPMSSTPMRMTPVSQITGVALGPMPEIDLGFPRSFVEFTNPDDPTEVYRCDLTWLTSRWAGIFGEGCPGIYGPGPDAGCCTLGARFADEADHARVAAVVEQLDPTEWERHDQGHREGWTERDEDGDLKTRAVD